MITEAAVVAVLAVDMEADTAVVLEVDTAAAVAAV